MFRQKKITGDLRAIGKNDYQKGKNLGAKLQKPKNLLLVCKNTKGILMQNYNFAKQLKLQ